MTNAWEEGGNCPSCGADEAVELAYDDDKGCSCYLCAPCSRCTSSFLKCSECGEREAEQRRMDAEGAVAWVDPKFLPSSDYPWTDARLLLEDGTKGTIPLYDRPANVPALEARIKELEAALTKLLAVSRTVNRYGAQTGGHWTPFSMELLMASSILNKARGE